MVHARRLSAFCGLLALCSVATSGAKASTFTGSLANDNSVVKIDFSTASAQNYTFDTTSYATGGFDPILTLFTSAGTFVPNGVSGGGADADFTETLTPGSYILALTEFPNFDNTNTITGFNPNNAAAIASICGASSPFEDAETCGLVPAAESQRTGNYAVDITSSSVTPEPPSALLLLLPLAGAVVLNRRKSADAVSR